jgi:hypothetical protein
MYSTSVPATWCNHFFSRLCAPIFQSALRGTATISRDQSDTTNDTITQSTVIILSLILFPPSLSIRLVPGYPRAKKGNPESDSVARCGVVIRSRVVWGGETVDRGGQRVEGQWAEGKEERETATICKSS